MSSTMLRHALKTGSHHTCCSLQLVGRSVALASVLKPVADLNQREVGL